MKLSALEIKSQEFKRALRGIDEAEVQSFLDMIATQWQDQQDEQRRTEEKLRELEAKIVHYQKIEEALQEALTSAKASSKATVAEASRRAEMVILEAESKANATAREAEGRVIAARSNLATLDHKRKEVVARLRAFLRSELELLDEFGSQRFDPVPDLPNEIGYLPEDEQLRAPAPMPTPAPPTVLSHAPYSTRRAADLLKETSDELDPYGDDETESFDRDGGLDDYAEVEANGRVNDSGRGPIEHQAYQTSDGGFDAEPSEIFVDESDLSDEPDEEMEPTDTESRIRRILDNLG